MNTHKVKIKICGVTNLDDALNIQASGADAIGFVFYRNSPRYISPREAKNIISRLNRRIKKIGVFVNSKPRRVKKIADSLKLDMLQFHGNETAGFCDKFRGYRRIKAFRLAAQGPSLAVKHQNILKNLDTYNVDYYLFDTFSKGSYGGTGRRFRGDTLKKIKPGRPFFLSGGLNYDNVVSAIKAVNPDWVDVSSAVERAPGLKDILKVKEFIRRARFQ